MDIDKNELYAHLQQLTDAQQSLVWDYILKTAAANEAHRRLSTVNDESRSLKADAGYETFSEGLSELIELGELTEFELFHIVNSRFVRQDFGAAAEAELKSNIDAIAFKKGIVIGRYFVGGRNICIVLDYANPQGDGRYYVNLKLQDE